jgi:hypothetical protein
LRTSKALAVVIVAATAIFARPLLAGDPESLLAAAAAGNVDIVRTIPDRGVSPDTRDQGSGLLGYRTARRRRTRRAKA